MKIRIKQHSYLAMWYHNRIGEEFEVTQVFAHCIPNQYEVDISHLEQAKEVTVNRGYVPFCDAEVLTGSEQVPAESWPS